MGTCCHADPLHCPIRLFRAVRLRLPGWPEHPCAGGHPSAMIGGAMGVPDDLEKRGFKFLEKKQWREARECFDQIRRHGLPPLREAEVMANIMASFVLRGQDR